MKLSEALSEKMVMVGMKGRTKSEAIRELARFTASSGNLGNEEELLETILEREKLQSTGIGSGVAIPHGQTESVKGVVCSLGISKEGIKYDSLDGKPVYLMFMLVASPERDAQYLSLLACIARIFRNPDLRDLVMNASSEAEVIELIRGHERGPRC